MGLQILYELFLIRGNMLTKIIFLSDCHQVKNVSRQECSCNKFVDISSSGRSNDVYVIKGIPTCLLNRSIGLVVRVFANNPEERSSILGRVIPKTQKMILDASLLNTQHYTIWIKGKVEQSRESSSPPSRHLDVIAIEKGAFESPSTMVANFTFHCFKRQKNIWAFCSACVTGKL